MNDRLTPDPAPVSRRFHFRRVASLAALAAIVALAALYGTRRGGNGPDAICAAAQPLAQRLKPLATGEVAAVNIVDRPMSLPALTFQGPDGTTQDLNSLRGQAKVFNLWATWCVPCRKEMPTLDALQAQLGGPGFEVVAVNMDSRNPDKPRAWMKEHAITHLAYRADPDGKVFQALRGKGLATGLPTTLILDKNNCLLGHIDGEADWSSKDALALVKALISP